MHWHASPTPLAGATLHTWRATEGMRRELPAGVYFLTVETDTRRATRMFILAK